MGKRHDTTTRGFTILEILVAVAIIALLLAILIPSLSQARKQAARMSCMSHLCAFGNTLNLVKSEKGRYPRRDPCPEDVNGDPIFDPPTFITKPVILKLLESSLDDPRTLYCPTSMRDDPYADKPYVESLTPDGFIRHWETGQISYIYLAGIRFTYPNEDNEPTFRPEIESPDEGRNADVVLVGDRVVEYAAGSGFNPGSNHVREGGWFYFTPGYTKWYPWKRLTAHPSDKSTWYWPRTGPPE